MMNTSVSWTIAVVALLVTGCVHEIGTDPQGLNLDPAKVSHLRGQQPVVIRNFHTSEAKTPIQLGAGKWAFDEQRFTNTAIAMLTRAMAQQGLKVAPNAEKSVVLRVSVLGMRQRVISLYAHYNARLALRAKFGDGTETYVEGENSGAYSPQAVFDGALLVALDQLVKEDKFVAYINR